jgi:hypothetical protein
MALVEEDHMVREEECHMALEEECHTVQGAEGIPATLGLWLNN